MKALTIWQPWASLIMAGAKPYEFRRWCAPRSLWRQRIVIHAGARKVVRDEVKWLLLQLQQDDRRGPQQLHWGTAIIPELAIPLLDRVYNDPTAVPLSSALGTSVLGEPRRVTDLFAAEVRDSDRLDHAMYGWPLTDIQAFEPFMPCRGAQRFWEFPVGVI